MIKKIDEHNLPDEDQDDQGGEGSQGGQSGAIEFRYRDILSGELADNLLSDADTNHLLIVHEDIHKERVDEQKRERKERDDIKNGRINVKNYDSLGLRIGGSGGGSGVSPYKEHPLSQHTQFSGATDRKVTGVPSDSLSKTNDDAKNELINELDLRNRLTMQNQPKFNPKPRGPYG